MQKSLPYTQRPLGGVFTFGAPAVGDSSFSSRKHYDCVMLAPGLSVQIHPSSLSWYAVYSSTGAWQATLR